MNDLLIYGAIIFCILLQTFAGYKKNKIVGLILPILFIFFMVFLIFSGNFEINIKNIIIPLLVLLALGSIYDSSAKSHDKKLKKELEKMKAKDMKDK